MSQKKSEVCTKMISRDVKSKSLKSAVCALYLLSLINQRQYSVHQYNQFNMSRPLSLFTSSLRSSLPQLQASSVAGPSSITLRAFSSTPATLVSKRKLLAKRKKAANLALQSSRIIPPESIDPVLGRVHYRAPSSRAAAAAATAAASSSSSTAATTPEPTNPWEGCRLQRILLNYDQIAYSSPPNYSQGEKPKYLLPGISEDDTHILFGAVPHASAALKYAANPHSASASGSESDVQSDQSKQSEIMMRVLDLRNAGKDSVKVLNRQRIVDEFGAGTDTGSSAVQGELLSSLSEPRNSLLI